MFSCISTHAKEDHHNAMNNQSRAMHCHDNFNLPVVAIDKDKHSLSALRWAIDHLVLSDNTIILLHVKVKHQTYSIGEIDSILQPFRTLCARRMIMLKENIVEDTDVSKAILDFVKKHCVTNLVLGASSKSHLTRMVWGHDFPAKIYKSSPDFCSARSYDDVSRAISSRGNSNLASLDRFDLSKGRRSIDCPSRTPPRSSISHYKEFNDCDSNASNYSPSKDVKSRKIEDVSSVSSDHSQMNDMDQEMQRLKLELMQTMNLYKIACKDAVSAKQTAKDLDDWKLEEMRMLEQARVAEVAAREMVEKEKAKCQAAIEAAEKAQKLAEMEAQRRIYAEHKAKREAEEKYRAMIALSHTDVRYRKYTIEELEEGTSNFSNERKIGEGSYGPVFQAKLDHTDVAIKVLRPDAVEGKRQFQQEVEVLCCIRHPNMVLLLGACPEYGCLVYEFMNYGSLENRLLRKDNTPSIPWEVRFKISAEIATGLLFLHQAKPEPLVHRDLKPANILLDRNYVCKISDVGLSRLVPPSVAESVTQYHMTSAAGTFCYIDPEYQQTGKLGTKSDIYSLGVMLLQIITAKSPMGLTHYVARAIEKGKLQDMLDPTVTNWPIEEVISYAKLALKCVELRKKERPDLATVIVPELNRLKELGMKNLSRDGI
ncbi:hypothetical protein Leryth_021548 [Lithospermum erythrorhizon]|nr:hypothetical protein Leryth_021548 [Lithospermum erythrorhizon]